MHVSAFSKYRTLADFLFNFVSANLILCHFSGKHQDKFLSEHCCNKPHYFLSGFGSITRHLLNTQCAHVHCPTTLHIYSLLRTYGNFYRFVLFLPLLIILAYLASPNRKEVRLWNHSAVCLFIHSDFKPSDRYVRNMTRTLGSVASHPKDIVSKFL